MVRAFSELFTECSWYRVNWTSEATAGGVKYGHYVSVKGGTGQSEDSRRQQCPKIYESGWEMTPSGV